MKELYKFILIISLKFSNFLYKLISFLAIKTEGGIHPKHRLIGYHQFFLKNVSSADKVLDIGCGNGALAFDIAQKAKEVVGIDINIKNILKAKNKCSLKNIKYITGDATKDLTGEIFDVVILSNVLEHIENRDLFLKNIKPIGRKFLIRVPMFDRDWLTLYKKELGVEWRLDKTHFVEYTELSFRNEIKRAGYKIEELSVRFGEIWAVIN